MDLDERAWDTAQVGADMIRVSRQIVDAAPTGYQPFATDEETAVTSAIVNRQVTPFAPSSLSLCALCCCLCQSPSWRLACVPANVYLPIYFSCRVLWECPKCVCVCVCYSQFRFVSALQR